MAPLDSGLDGETYREAEGWREEPPVTLETAETLGAAFVAAREALGRSIDELSLITRVPARYLKALEAGDMAALPSRPFALGHARAYARALGLDEEIAAERLKRESPNPAAALQAPVGAAFDDAKTRRSPLMIAAGLGLVLAVVGWNVFQRVTAGQAPPPSALAEVPESWRVGAPAGPVRLDAPRAAPPDQTVPVLYVTPGLEAELAPERIVDAAAPAPAAGAAPVRAAFNPRGAIYGESAARSAVTLQARRAAAIIVRGGDGVVHFARQLAAGEAYRAPRAPGVVVDVSEPAAFDLYLNGEHAGALQANVTPLAQLNARAEALAREAAEEVAERAARAATLSPAAG